MLCIEVLVCQIHLCSQCLLVSDLNVFICVTLLIQINLASSIFANPFMYYTNVCIFSSYFSCDFAGVLFTPAILHEFLYLFQKSIVGLHCREGSVCIETFTDSADGNNTCVNFLIVLIFECKLVLWVFSLSQNVFSLIKQDSIGHNSSLA